MKRLTLRTAIVGALVLAVVAATGTAIAASTGAGPSPSSFLDSLAKHLGVSRAKLDDAAKAAALDQVDAAVKAGKLTEEQGTQLKERIRSSDTPFFGFGMRGGFGHGLDKGERRGFDFGFGIGPGLRGGGVLRQGLDTAADYLGLTEAKLREQLADGKTLAEIAKAQGKTADGLTKALLADTRKRLDQAVKDGKLTRAQADKLLELAETAVGRLVDGSFLRPFRGGMWHGFPGFGKRDGGSPSYAPVMPVPGAPA